MLDYEPIQQFLSPRNTQIKLVSPRRNLTKIKPDRSRSQASQGKIVGYSVVENRTTEPSSKLSLSRSSRRTSSFNVRSSTAGLQKNNSNKPVSKTTSSNKMIFPEIESKEFMTTLSYKPWTTEELQEIKAQRLAKWEKYKPTKLKIKMNVHLYDHHLLHPINMLIHDYNEFVRLVLKQLARSNKPPHKADV